MFVIVIQAKPETSGSRKRRESKSNLMIAYDNRYPFGLCNKIFYCDIIVSNDPSVLAL